MHEWTLQLIDYDFDNSLLEITNEITFQVINNKKLMIKVYNHTCQWPIKLSHKWNIYKKEYGI